ncbi:hypothetical protein [Galbitalea soli]|uniref:Uncharacterized protein n=1 Tax=Galbitalea soli TaxID=1268042 RepID=A0A7C9PLB6_9MICO|nr:hypothetical protein [Galbitalea soli]NEM89911.1 hypothetical protein [Galbitalea soli]NYJ30615.1 hypothetical protein [Galbitalea soli]
MSDPGVAPRRTRRRSTTAADWVALVLAVIAPPLGVVVALVDIIASSRMRGWSSNLAKSALGIAIALSLVVAGGVVVLQGIAADRARAQASLAAAAPLCALLTASPATLDSPTFGWPAPEESIPQSIAAMRAFDVAWQRNVAAAPAGVKRSVQLVESAAHGIITSVTATQTLDDAANVGLMQQAAAASGLNNWADEYCTG